MSERDFLRMTDDEVLAHINECTRAQVATILPDGRPHVVPLSYMVFDDHLCFWTDPGSQKVSNLRRDPRITCVIECGDEFAEFRAVQIFGDAELIDDLDVSRRAGETLFARSRGELTDDLRNYAAMLAPQRVVVKVEPVRIVSWDHRKMAGVTPAKIGR